MFRCYNRNINFLTQTFLTRDHYSSAQYLKVYCQNEHCVSAIVLKSYSDIDFVFIKQHRGDLIGCFRDSQTLPSQFVFIDRTRQSYTESLENNKNTAAIYFFNLVF